MELSFQFSMAMDVAAIAYITYFFKPSIERRQGICRRDGIFGIDLDSLPARFPLLHFVNEHPSTNPISILNLTKMAYDRHKMLDVLILYQ